MNALLFESAAIAFLFWSALSAWLLQKWLRQQRAWRWWQTRQMLLSAHQADVIRDGLLQQTLAFRRYLENARDIVRPSSQDRHLESGLERSLDKRLGKIPGKIPGKKPEKKSASHPTQYHTHLPANHASSIADQSYSEPLSFNSLYADFPRLEQSEMFPPTIRIPDKQAADWIERFERIYQSLETLSNTLSPPYLTESLPLALQFVVNHFDNNPFGIRHWPCDFRIQFCCDSQWPYPTPNKNQIVVPTVIELLTVLAVKGELQSPNLKLTLNSRMTRRTLTFRLDNCDRLSMQKITKCNEIRYLKEIFHSLAAGRLEIIHEGTALVGQLSWYDE